MTTKELTGKLEGLSEEPTGENKPYLKLKVAGRTYSYFNDDPDKIKETKEGLKPFIDEDISFKYYEKEVEGREHPYKNIVSFSTTLKKASEQKTPPKKEKPAAPVEEKVETTRKVTLMVGLAKTINLGDYSTVRPEFRIEEEIEGDMEDIEKLKDEWLEKFRLWIDAEETQHR